MPEKAT